MIEIMKLNNHCQRQAYFNSCNQTLLLKIPDHRQQGHDSDNATLLDT